MSADYAEYREAAKHLGLAIKRKRSALGLSLETVGERAGLRWKEISDLESGDATVPLGVLLAVAAALDIKMGIDDV